MIRTSLLFAGLALVLTGCGSSVSEAAQSPADASAAQIKALDNNPNMPEAQKQALKARLEQQKAAGQAYANSPKK
ncbi:MAG: hypothetical protein JST51_04715 [Armatimonadetes bacterium]|nr:hypothetical protein [Armatimonadota bacterium]